MATRNAALGTFGAGVVAFVAGVYGVVGPEVSIVLAGFGLLALLMGPGLLLAATRPWNISRPHPYVIVIAVVGATLHAYELLHDGAEGASSIFFLWPMVPYGLCLVLSAFTPLKLHVIAAVSLVLALDLLAHYSVFINPQSSTVGLLMLFVPLWSTIIVVPLATFVSWAVAQWRREPHGDAP